MSRLRSLLSGLVFLAMVGVAAPAGAESPIVWVFTDNNAIRAYNQGVSALNDGKPEAAIKGARKALARDENAGPAHLLLGIALLRSGDVEGSLEVLRALDRRAPGRPEVLAEMANSLFAKGEFEAAASTARASIERDPDRVDGWFALVNARRRTGDLQALTQDLQADYERNPRPEIACFQVLVYVDEEQVEPARHAMSLCEASEDPNFQTNARYALQRSGYAEEAADGEGAAVSRGTALLNKGIEALNAQEWDKAVGFANRAEKVGGSDVYVRLVRAEGLYRLARYDEATADLDAVLADSTWVEVGKRGGVAGVLTKSAEEDVADRVRSGAAIAVLLAARDGGAKAFEARLADVRASLGDAPELRAAEVEALRITGSLGRAWTVLAEALAQGDPAGLHSPGLQDLGAEGVAVATDEQLDAVIAGAHPADLFNLAVAASRANLYARCVRVVSSLLDGGAAKVAHEQFGERTLGLRDEVVGLTYGCAVDSEEIAAADQRGTQAGWGPALKTNDLWNHAVLLLEAERWDALITHVRDHGLLGRTDPVGDARTFLVHGYVALDRLDEALAVVRAEDADPVDRLRVGIALARADRAAEVRSLLDGLCGSFDGQNAEACTGTLEWAKQP